MFSFKYELEYSAAGRYWRIEGIYPRIFKKKTKTHTHTHEHFKIFLEENT